MTATKSLPCTCAHEFQDKTYGTGKRVHNLTSKTKWRCTVCKNERTAGGEVIAVAAPTKKKKGSRV